MITDVKSNKENTGNFVTGSSTTYFPPGSTANNAAILGGAQAGLAALPDPNKATATKPNTFSDATNPQKPASPATPAVTTTPITTPGIGVSATALPQTSAPTIDYSSAAGKDMNEQVRSGLNSPATPAATSTPATAAPTALSATGQDLSGANSLNKAADIYASMRTQPTAAKPAVPDFNDPKQMSQLMASVFGGNGSTLGTNELPANPIGQDLTNDLGRAGMKVAGGLGFKSGNPYQGADTTRLKTDPFTTTSASRALFS